MKSIIKKSSGSILGLGFALFASTSVRAYPAGNLQSIEGEIGLGAITVAGSGCPEGSVHTDLSSSGDSLVLRFDEFFASAGAEKSLDRKACMLALPLRVPQGLRVRTAAITLQGFAYLPEQAEGRVSIDTFFAGARGVKVTKNFSENFMGEFSLSTSSTRGQWSACGEDVLLRANMSVLVRNQNPEEQALVAVTEQHGKQSSYIVDLEFDSCD